MRIVAFLIICFTSLLAQAEESFLKPNDVVAFIGGEDMVTISESGYLEMALTLALPDHKLKFRNLAKEGDTVYQQRRDLNFPDLAAQLDKAGATVVLCQFGKMECLVEGKTTENFASAYRNMIEKVAADGKRRVAVVWPEPFKVAIPQRPIELSPDGLSSLVSDQKDPRNLRLSDYQRAISALCTEKNLLFTPTSPYIPKTFGDETNDKIRLNDEMQKLRSLGIAGDLSVKAKLPAKLDATVLKLIAAKNKLWFHYTRPQNWAFLGGDRTEQPSSHDHVNTSYRWFPVEMEEFLVLMAAKEEEIWKLAKEAK